ncbi:MAG: hypothetical protein KKA32_11530 [Actinobacteria bacterium]|nr:hypothetical protein [Actinomycetota bacterium]
MSSSGGRRYVRAALVVLTSLALVLLLSPAALAAGMSASSMKVSIWPEYDDPRVLVIYQAELDESVQLPVDVTFNVPKGADIAMACEVDPSDGHSCKPFQLIDQGDYQSLTYTVEAQRKVFFEYYYDAFPVGQAQREFDVPLRLTFPVAELTVEVLEPARSSGFVLNPDFPRQTRDSKGLTYYLQTIASPALEEPVTVGISYSKQDADPSVAPSSDGSPPSPAAAGGSTGSSNGKTFAFLVVVVGIAALGLGGYSAFRPRPAVARSRDTTPNRRPSRPVREVQGGDGRSARGQGKFCTQCGEKIGGRDRFCPDCGNEQG